MRTNREIVVDALIDYAANELYSYQDRGPTGEGWQSDQLTDLLYLLQEYRAMSLGKRNETPNG